MAKAFDPSTLPQADQAAFRGWQSQLQQYVAANGGAIPAPVSYALAHPDYLQQHPELQQDYNIVSGATLPASTRDALKDFHPVWSGGAGMEKNSSLWNKWETWLQLGLGAAVAAPVVLPALGVGGGAAGATAAGSSAVPALGGGTTLAANLGGAGALGAGGSALGTAAAASSPFWKKILPGVIGAGANLAGNLIQSHQIDKATQAQVDAANRALALQQNIYQQQRADLAPYRGLGSGAAQFLSQGLGLPPATDTTIPAFQPQPPQQAQRNPNSPVTTPVQQAVPRSMATLGGSGTVNMIAPDGRPAQVPQAQVQAALAAGGRLA